MSYTRIILLFAALLVTRVGAAQSSSQSDTDNEGAFDGAETDTSAEDASSEESGESEVADASAQEGTASLEAKGGLNADASLSASSSADSEEEGKGKETLAGALKTEPGFKIEGNIAGLWMYRDDYEKPMNEFRVNRARLKFTWSQWQLIEAVVKVEAKELFKGSGIASILRDAYVRVQPIPQLGLRVGQFKKPYSSIALSPMGSFRLIRRGIGDRYISDRLLYGGRDIGAMLEGRLVQSVKLDYSVGAFNGMGMNTREIGFDGTKDVVARLEIEPVEWLDIGAGASLKFIEKTDLPGFIDNSLFDLVVEDEYPYGYTDDDFMEEYEWMTGMYWMAEADASVKVEKFRAVVEGRLGQNWWFENYPYLWSALVMASYKFKIKSGLPVWIEPVVKGEVMTFMTDGMGQWRNRLWQITPGLNLHIGRHTRLMIDGEFAISQGKEADIDGSRRDGLWPNEYAGNWGDSKRVMVQLAFSL